MTGEFFDLTVPQGSDGVPIEEQRARLARARILANAQLLDGAHTEIRIDHDELQQAARDIGERIVEANSSL